MSDEMIRPLERATASVYIECQCGKGFHLLEFKTVVPCPSCSRVYRVTIETAMQ